ncbi:MAG: glycosyltransferase family 39 protein, partial [Anaerolineae bacterium]|nr:glycosyltransferase family 39 protein [Anaerolineae bacterium]
MKKLTRHRERFLIILMVLLAWVLRWTALMDVPPGWRDDDLVEVYTFSNEILSSGIKLYYAEAWGQAPLYHIIRAPILAFGGVNQASVRWLSASCGTLAVLLTWAVGSRLFGRIVGLLAGTLSALSFWSLMYSRVAIRHIGALPWMLLAIYWGWRLLHEDRRGPLAFSGVILGTAGAMLTYYAGRLIPVLLAGMLILVKSSKIQRMRVIWAVLAGLALTIPTFATAYFTPGADARVSELATPILALLDGNPHPLLQTAWWTLGMFHAHGDPEYLYNIPFRPVFGPLTALLFAVSLLSQIYKLRNSNSILTLWWLLLGISPALISLPESSLGHTILAQPAAMIVLAAVVTAAPQRWSKAVIPAGALLVLMVAIRDLPDYFVRWPQHAMVHFLYRGDYRAVANYLDSQPEMTDAAVGTMLFGQWDKVAVKTDIRRQDAHLRWVNPDRALLNRATGSLVHYLQEESTPVPVIQGILDNAESVEAPPGLQGYLIALPVPGIEAIRTDQKGTPLHDLLLNNSLVLEALVPYRETAGTYIVLTWWRVAGTLPLPPEKLYPPPYGVYGGPRLSVFAQILKNGEYV